MGLFNFKKKVAPQLEKGFTDAVKPNPTVTNSITQEVVNNRIGVNIAITSTDCAYDRKHKTYVYSTGLIPDIKEGFIMIVKSNKDLKELNQQLVNSPILIDDNFVGELFLDFKPSNGRFVKQPYHVGEVIANYIIVPAKDVEKHLED